MSWIKSVLAGLLLSIISISIFCGVAEIVVRLAYPNLVPSTKYDWRSRHDGYAIEKAPNTFRIFVTGDSYTYGQGVSRDETFSKRLEGLLNNIGGKTKFEVINQGYCGMNTIGEVEIIAERGLNPKTWDPDPGYRGLAYKPDLILVVYTLGDSSTSGRALEQIKPFDEKWRLGVIRINSGAYALPLPEGVDRFLTRNSRFYLYFLGKYNQILGSLGLREVGESAVKKGTFSRYKEDFEGWQGVQWAFGKMAGIRKAYGIPIVLVVYPEMYKLDNYPLKELHEKVKATASLYGLYSLDMLQAFKGMDWHSLQVNILDGHPNAKSHEIAAKTILEYLKGEKLVPLTGGRDG